MKIYTMNYDLYDSSRPRSRRSISPSQPLSGCRHLHFGRRQKPPIGARVRSVSGGGVARGCDLLSVVLIHGALYAFEGIGADGVGSQGDALVHGGHLLVSETSENEIYLSAAGEVVADAETQAGVLLRAEDGGDMAETVVASLAAAGFHTQRTERQGEVIGDDEELVDGDFLLVKPVTHGITAEIHIGGGLEEEELLVLHAYGGDETIAAVLPSGTGIGSQLIDDAETHIMARVSIFDTDIAETCN